MSRNHTHRGPVDTGLGEDPLRYAHTLYTGFLQGVFNFLPSGTARWENDDDNSEIWIGADAPLDMQVIGKRPAITVVMTATQTAGMGINNMVEQNLSTNEKLLTDLESGHFVVYCLAHSETRAMWLAQIVRNSTRVHRQLLESERGFFSIARPSVGINSPSPPGALIQGDSPGSLVMVQVNVPFQFQTSWRTSIGRQAPQFRSVDQILGQLHASDYDYTSPATLEKVELNISTRPVTVRVIRGRYATRPTTVEVGQEIDPFQRADLRPFEES